MKRCPFLEADLLTGPFQKIDPKPKNTLPDSLICTELRVLGFPNHISLYSLTTLPISHLSVVPPPLSAAPSLITAALPPLLRAPSVLSPSVHSKPCCSQLQSSQQHVSQGSHHSMAHVQGTPPIATCSPRAVRWCPRSDPYRGGCVTCSVCSSSGGAQQGHLRGSFMRPKQSFGSAHD